MIEDGSPLPKHSATDSKTDMLLAYTARARHYCSASLVPKLITFKPRLLWRQKLEARRGRHDPFSVVCYLASGQSHKNEKVRPPKQKHLLSRGQWRRRSGPTLNWRVLASPPKTLPEEKHGMRPQRCRETRNRSSIPCGIRLPPETSDGEGGRTSLHTGLGTSRRDTASAAFLLPLDKTRSSRDRPWKGCFFPA